MIWGYSFSVRFANLFFSIQLDISSFCWLFPVLYENFRVCLVLPSLSVLWKPYVRRHLLHQCLGVLSLHILPATSQSSGPCFRSLIRLGLIFACLSWVWVYFHSSIYQYPVLPAPFVEDIILTSLCEAVFSDSSQNGGIASGLLGTNEENTRLKEGNWSGPCKTCPASLPVTYLWPGRKLSLSWKVVFIHWLF